MNPTKVPGMKVTAQVRITTSDGRIHEPGTIFDTDAVWLVEQGLAVPVKSKKPKTWDQVVAADEVATEEVDEGVSL